MVFTPLADGGGVWTGYYEWLYVDAESRCHREDGPAHVHDGTREWWLHGVPHLS